MNNTVAVPNDQPIVTFIFWIVVLCAIVIFINMRNNRK